MRHDGRLPLPQRKTVPTRRASERFRRPLSQWDVYGRTKIRFYQNTVLRPNR